MFRLKKECTSSELETIFNNYYERHKTVILTIMSIMIWLFTLPELYRKRELWGLDDSWIYYINSAAGKNYIFGRDVFFTYGPFGFLLYPLNIDNNMVICMLFTAGISLYVLYAVLHFLSKKNRQFYYIVIVLTLLLFFRITELRVYIFSVFILSGMLICDNEKPLLNFSFLCLYTAFMWFVKFDMACLGLLVVALGLICILVRNINEKKSFKQIFIIFVLSVMIIPAFIVMYLIYNPSWYDMITYIKNGLQVSSGYSYAMSVGEPSLYLKRIAVYSCLYTVIFLITVIWKRNESYKILICAPFILFAYKYGVVRCDKYHTYLLDYIIAIIGFWLIVTLDFDDVFHDSRKTQLLRAVLCILIMFVTCGEIAQLQIIILFIAGILLFFNNKWIQSFRICLLALTLPFVLQQRGMEVLYACNAVVNASNEDICVYNNDKLPENIKDKIGTEKVVFYPWDILRAESDDIDFICPPVIQAYSAYTPLLDEINAGFFNSEDAPRYIVFEPKTIDNRFMLWETPETLTAIENNYQISDISDGTTIPIILLEKKEKPLPEKETIKTETIQNIGKELIIPETAESISISVKPTVAYILLNSLYRTDPVICEFKFTDGSIQKYRVMTEQLSSVLPLQSNILDSEKKIKSIRFDTDTLHCVDSNLVFTIYYETGETA